MTLLLWLWCFPQMLLGAILQAVMGAKFTQKVSWARVYAVSQWNDGGISLGAFILLGQKNATNDEDCWHEFGHCRQSIFLGPLYLLIVGLPSIIRAGVFGQKVRSIGVAQALKWYYGGYPERWADRLGAVRRGK